MFYRGTSLFINIDTSPRYPKTIDIINEHSYIITVKKPIDLWSFLCISTLRPSKTLKGCNVVTLQNQAKALSYIIIIFILSSCFSAPRPASLPDDNDFRIGETYFLRGQFREALTYYQRYLTRYPRSPDEPYILCQMGLCTLDLSENDQALGYFQRAFETLQYYSLGDPVRNNVEKLQLKARVLIGLGHAYSNKGDYAQAVPYYMKALKETRAELNDEATTLFNLATALMRSGDWSGSRKYLTELVGLKSAPERLIEAAQTRLALPEGIFIVQLGKYQDKDNALRYLNELKEEKDITAELKILLINGDFLYFVWAGSFPDWRPAQKLAEELQTKGIEALVIP
jgi:tetratricopeptide (TPR) repeat protein